MTTFTEFFTKLRENIDQLHQDRQQFYQNTREQINEMAKQLRCQLAEFAGDLQAGSQAFHCAAQSGNARPHRSHSHRSHSHKA
ncbi:MAG: hypothetical protein ABSA77_09445 [Thermoguttaceae bacterium]|jgi:hypothetical protein